MTAQIDEQIDTIKMQMPETYKRIQAEADARGREAYKLVRDGLRGLPNRFYACERGYVMGTPFNVGGITEAIAKTMVEFGATFICVFPTR